MSDQAWNEPVDEEEGPVLKRRRLRETADISITPMIDITFLLLIFFLVASIPDATIAVQLPPARHGKAVNPRTSVILTVAEGGREGGATVYLGDGKVGRVLTQDNEITDAVRAGFGEGKLTVLIKAEKGVKHREVSRVSAAAARVEGIRLHLAVLEVE
ncbi:MAG: ExbD/TolR family protein [Planctomycetota bacterium]|jgi:biopolymer transport protein ExbD